MEQKNNKLFLNRQTQMQTEREAREARAAFIIY